MNEDKFLKDLLSDYHPQLSDDNAYMQSLQRQMELMSLNCLLSGLFWAVL